MSSEPAETIRAYLERNSGGVSVPFHNLLTTWQLDQAGKAEREQMERELMEAGVAVEPPLAELGPDDELRVGIAAEPVEKPTEPKPEPDDELPPDPPWASELAAAAPRPRRRRRPLRRRIAGVRRDVVGFGLVLLSGGLAAAAGYVLGKGF